MSKKSRRRKSGARFFTQHLYLFDSPAFQDLQPVAQALYPHIKRRYNGFNNGSIGLGVREAAKLLNRTESTAKRAFDELIEHGFIEVATPSSFDQKRLAREWLLTEYRDDRTGTVPRKSFLLWRLGVGVPPEPAKNHFVAPRMKPIAPYVAPKALDSPDQEVSSDADGTVDAGKNQTQCHQRHTSISKPGGVKVTFGLPMATFRTAVNRPSDADRAETPPTTLGVKSETRVETLEDDTDRYDSFKERAVLTSSNTMSDARVNAQVERQKDGSGIEAALKYQSRSGASIPAKESKDEAARSGVHEEEACILVDAILKVFPGARVVA